MTEHESFFEELRREIDDAHEEIVGAARPPTDAWASIRVRVGPAHIEEIEENTMMQSISIPASPVIEPRRNERLRHSLGLVASFLIVTSVALGGWFATMQLNAPGTPEPRFAALGTPTGEVGSGICDVEPITIDEAMVILVNPYQAIEVDEEFARHVETLDWLKDQSGSFGRPPLERVMSDSPNGDVKQSDLDKALAVGDTYLACVQHGTRAQVYRLLDPAFVHEHLRDLLPLFTSEDEARRIIEDDLSKSGNTVWTEDFAQEYLADKSIRMNRNREHMYIDSSHSTDAYLLDAIVIAPIVIYDENGEVVFETAFGGFPITNNGRATDYARNVVIAKSPFNKEWYVFNIYRP